MKTEIWFVAALAAAACACSGSGGPYVSPEAGAFPAQAFETGTTASNTWQYQVRLLPAMPVRGTSAAELTFIDPASGLPVDGLLLQVTPWMPSMNHGDDLYPTIDAAGQGRYVVGNLDFYMPGRWELVVTVSGPNADAGVDGAAATDTLTPLFDVP